MLVKCVVLAVALATGFLVTDNLCVPQQYRGNAKVTVYFTDEKGIAKHCGVSRDPSLTTLACSQINGHKMVVLNPCLDQDADTPETYAHVLCHELAHVNGWEHPEAGRINLLKG
jgi:predicted Zn-dependent protease